MIHDIDESLRELVKRDVVNGANVDVTFDAPTKDWSSRRTGPTLNLYLYDIQEDMQRRAVQFEEVRNERGTVVDRRMLPRKFRLSYLVTAWTQRPEDEHRLLSAMMGCFLRAEALPKELLQGSAVEAEEPIRTTIGLPLPKDRQLSDIWTALGGELKPALDLVVTAPFDPKRMQEVGPPVTEEPRIAIAGPDGLLEVAGKRGRAAAAAAMAAARAAALGDLEPVSPIEETVYGAKPDPEGKPVPGRRITIRTIPRD